MIWFIIIVGALLALALWPFYLERQKIEIGPVERQRSDGELARLSQGVTHFRWVGPTRGPVAVMIHGLTTPLIAMDSVAQGLGDLGYRVLMYDLYGRGLSDAPAGRQDRAFFLRQLSDLLVDQKVEDEITLVGYSMGGSIATAFAAEYPHRIKRVILLASAGVRINESGFARFCRRVPLLGDWVHGLFAHKRILDAIPAKSLRPEVQNVLIAQRRELDRRGYLPAILSSRRGILNEVMEKDHRKLGRENVPVIAVWGKDDQVVPISALGALAQWNRLARQEEVVGADHALPYTHAEELIDAMRSALRD